MCGRRVAEAGEWRYVSFVEGRTRGIKIESGHCAGWVVVVVPVWK